MLIPKTTICVILAAALAAAQTPPLAQRIASRLRPNDLKADVSFLASDLLEGRATPSPGLTLAAEYIASQFRRGGLEPAGDDGYFQTGTFLQVAPNTEGLRFSLGSATAGAGAISIQEPVAVDLNGAAAVKISAAEGDALTPEQVKGKVLLLDVGDPGAGAAGFQALRRVQTAVTKFEPALLVLVRGAAAAQGGGGGRGPRAALRDATAPAAKVPILTISDAAIHDALAAAKPGPMETTVSAHIAAPKIETVKLRNVAAVIRGADPVLKDSYLVVTAHYDHLGMNPNLEGDKIFNGANDDASGTSSLIEIGGALNAVAEKPRRTIVFVAVYGEESGGYGARWYTSHPIFPLDKTVADINLEHMGRTDDTEGPRVRQFNLTGYDYTDIAATFAKAGAETDIQVVKHEKNSDAFFARSDNVTFAQAGVPDTTVSVTYTFPDYHRVGDEWPKLDYDNMAKVDQCVALGIWSMANSDRAPAWNKDNPKTAPYVRAREGR